MRERMLAGEPYLASDPEQGSLRLQLLEDLLGAVGEDVELRPPLYADYGTNIRRQKWEAAKPITIGANVRLGGGAIVLAGVTIGANTVVGAGAVVTRDLPPDVVAVGLVLEVDPVTLLLAEGVVEDDVAEDLCAGAGLNPCPSFWGQAARSSKNESQPGGRRRGSTGRSSGVRTWGRTPGGQVPGS